MSELSVTTDVGVLQVGESRSIDSKAMRKVEDGSTLVEVIEASGISSGVNVRLFSRILIKLH